MAAPVALCLHGQVSSWRGRKKLIAAEDTADVLNRSRRSLVRLAADSLLRNVVDFGRREGTPIDVFIHSWNPELGELLDELYQPQTSRHEPVLRNLTRLATAHFHLLSRHFSLRAVVQMVPATVSLVMVARLDLLLYEPISLPALLRESRGRPSLWLPQKCQPRYGRHSFVGTRYGVPAHEESRMHESCGCVRVGDCLGGRGHLLESPSLDGMQMRGYPPPLSHSLYVLDWWLVATREVAGTFGDIYDGHDQYARELAARMRAANATPRQHLWPSAHFFWAHHVTNILPSNVAVHFGPLLSGRDFTLARNARFGRDCEAPVRAAERMPDTMSAAAAGLSARSIHARLVQQCPSRFQRSTALLCPHDTPVCPSSIALSVASTIRATEASLSMEGLPPSHALDAGRATAAAMLTNESCTTPWARRVARSIVDAEAAAAARGEVSAMGASDVCLVRARVAGEDEAFVAAEVRCALRNARQQIQASGHGQASGHALPHLRAFTSVLLDQGSLSPRRRLPDRFIDAPTKQRRELLEGRWGSEAMLRRIAPVLGVPGSAIRLLLGSEAPTVRLIPEERLPRGRCGVLLLRMGGATANVRESLGVDLPFMMRLAAPGALVVGSSPTACSTEAALATPDSMYVGASGKRFREHCWGERWADLVRTRALHTLPSPAAPGSTPRRSECMRGRWCAAALGRSGCGLARNISGEHMRGAGGRSSSRPPSNSRRGRVGGFSGEVHGRLPREVYYAWKAVGGAEYGARCR